jgi:hypothetical protein
MMAKLLRLLGLRCHRWAYRRAAYRVCKDCGEHQMKYVLWVKGDQPTWWETSQSGDGSCGVKEKPIRIC